MKEIRELNVMFAKSDSDSSTTRITLPIKWVKDMNITEDDRVVKVKYDKDTKTMTIKK